MTSTPARGLFLGLIATLFLTMAAQGQQPTQLYAFRCTSNGCPDGQNPQTVIQASDGNFYGAAHGDGGPSGEGTIFKVTPSGQFTLLHTSFGPVLGPAVVEAGDGNLYGATADYSGFVFKISKSGSGYEVVHSFNETDLGASLTVGKDGNLYGSTVAGGTVAKSCELGCGTIFRIDVKTGVFTNLHELNGATDGSSPSGLIQASDGNFYGTSGPAPNKVFRVTPGGAFSVVGQLPSAYTAFGGVIQASDGRLYGMLNDTRLQQPRLFKLGLDGSGFHAFPALSQLLHVEFVSTLLQAKDGNLWLTTYASAGSNAIVSLTFSTGALRKNIPYGTIGTALIQGKDGDLYGTAFGGTVKGGTAGGEVFKLNPGQAASAPPQ